MKKASKPPRKWGMAMLQEKWKVSYLFSIEFLLKSWSQICGVFKLKGALK
jgi:hypothetical protein